MGTRIAVLSGIFLLAAMVTLPAEDLRAYRGKNRVVLLVGGEKVREQKLIFDKEAAGLKERDLIFLTIAPEDKATLAKYNLNKDEYTFLLIGKDGGEKFRSSKLVSSERLFALVDAMPMRRDEMKGR